jgi:hypothetical protein
MEREESNDDDKHRCKIIVKPIELHFKTERITIGGNVEIKENIRLKVCNGTEDHTKGIRATRWI